MAETSSSKITNDAVDAAAFFATLLKKSIAEHRRQADVEELALKAAEAVAALPKAAEQDFRKPADRGKDILKRALDAAGAGGETPAITSS